MRAGDTATYGLVELHSYGPTRLTFECLDSQYYDNRFGQVRHWLFHVRADTGGAVADRGGFCVVILLGPYDPTEFDSDDWEQREKTIILGNDAVVTRDDVSPAEATARDVDITAFERVASYSTESATLTSALFHAVEEADQLVLLCTERAEALES